MWFVEPARLIDRFELDQRGERTVRLVRTIRTLEMQWGLDDDRESRIDRG